MLYNKAFLPVSKSCKLADMRGEFKPPKKPVYSRPDKCVEVVQTLHRALARQKLELIGKPLSPANLTALVRTCREVTECEPELARNLLQPFLNCLITKRIIDLICWQIAGNRKRLLTQEVLLYSGKPTELGWMNGAIADHLSDPGSTLGSYRVRILDGPAAGFDLYMPVPKSFTRMSYALGATYKVDKMRIKLLEARQAVQMQVLVFPAAIPLLQFQAHVGHSTANFNLRDNSIDLLRATPKQKAFNLNLMRDRKKSCIRNLTTPCCACSIGYDSCPRGTHLTTIQSLPAVNTITIRGKNICQKNLDEV